MANNGPRINGHRYDFSSVTIDALGPLRGVKEIKYGNEKAGTIDYELGSAEPSARTRGELKPTATMTLYRDAYNELLKRLGDGYLEKVWNMTVSYADPGTPTVTDRLIGIKITKDELGVATGGDGAEVPLDLQPMRVIPSGTKPLLGMKE